MKHVFWELSRGLQLDHQLGTRRFSARLCRTGSDTERGLNFCVHHFFDFESQMRYLQVPSALFNFCG